MKNGFFWSTNIGLLTIATPTTSILVMKIDVVGEAVVTEPDFC